MQLKHGTVYVSGGEEETERLAAHFARQLHNGEVIALIGPLGAGKTRFVKGLVRGLGGRAEEAVSPTFTLVHPLPCKNRTLFHFDLYRLDDAIEIARLVDEEFVPEEGLAVIEWFDKLEASGYPWQWRITLEWVPGREKERRIRVERGKRQGKGKR